MTLESYFLLLKDALIIINNIITNLGLTFLNKTLDLKMVIGIQLMGAILAAILYPRTSEYENF